MTTERVAVKVRPMRQSDLAWILSSWLGSYHHNARSTVVQSMPSGEFKQRWHRVAEALIARSSVLVACADPDDNLICGWLCSEPGVLHYVHVKQCFQRFGIARTLLEAAGFSPAKPALFSHRTTDSDRCPLPEQWRSAPWLTIGIR